MKIILPQPFRTLKPGTLEITPNKPNYWVGLNGTGKSSLVQLFLAQLFNQYPKLKKKEYWFSTVANHTLQDTPITIEGMDNIQEVLVYSDKLSQARWIDMGACLALPGSVGTLNASEGQTSVMFLGESAKAKGRKNVLHIFDEIDGHFDFRTKHIFFNRLLHMIKGTSIIISHDSLFMMNERVFDFGDWTHKQGGEYYSQHMI